MKRLLQFVGVAALVLWTAAGAAAWALVGKGVNVTVAADSQASGRSADDAMALLRDEVASVQRDVSAMAENVARALERLAAGMQEDAGTRHEALRGALASWRAQAERDATARTSAIADLAQRLAELTASVKASTTNVQSRRSAERSASALEPVATEPGLPPMPSEAPAAVAIADPPHPDPSREDPTRSNASPPEPPVASEPPTVPPAARRPSFLAFSLPSATRFDRPCRFELQGALSRVGFDAKSTLHDFSGVTSRVTGDLVLDLTHAERTAHGRVTVQADALSTGLDGRDSAMREHLDTEHHPQLVFELTRLTPAATTDLATLRVDGTAYGRMTIRGVTRDLAMPVRLHVDEAKRLVVDGECSLRLTDYGVPVPGTLGLISMQDEVKVWVALRARCVGAAKENE